MLYPILACQNFTSRASLLRAAAALPGRAGPDFLRFARFLSFFSELFETAASERRRDGVP